jgi:hypothetical protein
MHTKAAMLRADRTGQADLGQDGTGSPFRDTRGGQPSERRPEPNTTLVEPLSQLVALQVARVGGQQGGYVPGGRRCFGLGV